MPLRHSAGLPGAARGRIPGTWDAHREVRAAVLRFLAMGLVAVIVVSVPVAVWIRAVSKEYAVDTAQGVTQRLADYAVAPLATKALLAGESAALERLRQRLAPWLEDGAVEEIMVWDGRGRIVYSNVATHIGQRHALPVQGRDLEEGRTVAWEATPAHTNPAPHESHESHGNAQSLVGVFVGTTTRDGQPLVIEAYFDGESVKQEHADMVLGMAPAVLLALVVLQIAQLVPAVRLARRIQRHRLARQLLLQRALEASDTERKRIARNLHDDVIQELSGLAYALQAEGKDGPTPQRPLILQAGTMLQDNIHRLREMTSACIPRICRSWG